MGKRATYDFSVETRVPPDQMLAAAIDFSDRRPDIWPNVSRKQYHVYSVGDYSADVEEGTSPFHHRAKYEWSDQGVVRALTIDASGVAQGSVWEMRVRPHEESGSHVDIHVEMEYKGAVGAMARLVTRLSGGGAAIFRKWFMQTVHILEAQSASTSAVGQEMANGPART